jgi:glyoxylase-like metal-dependent hydrolase (beta-lactamase superfamily II)
MSQTVIQLDADRVTHVFLIHGAEGAVLVDTGSPGAADTILEQMRGHGVAPQDLRLILITHGHTDHFGSAAALRERTGAPVAVHKLDAEALRQGVHQPGSLKPTGPLLALVMRLSFLRTLAVPDRVATLEPDIAFETPFRLEPYGVAGEAIHTPGHTPGAVSVVLDDGAAIVGDMVMGQLMGFLPRPGKPIVAWDLERNRESVRKLMARSPRIIYTAHGGPFQAEELSKSSATE